MFAPWLAHHFPGVTLLRLQLGEWSISGIVAMGDFAKAHSAMSEVGA